MFYMTLAATVLPSTFSFGVLLTLFAILLVSGRMFYVLTRQWTTHRPVQALREWAQDHGFDLELKPDANLPTALAGLADLNPQMEMTLTSGSIQLVRLSTRAKPTLPRPIWNLLILEKSLAENPSGLRPAAASVSFLDLFSISGFPSLLPPERFVACAQESKDAKRIAASPALGLLPADIGLLLHGPYLTLDFSSRPFDAIEFDRMLVILKQITAAS